MDNNKIIMTEENLVFWKNIEHVADKLGLYYAELSRLCGLHEAMLSNSRWKAVNAIDDHHNPDINLETALGVAGFTGLPIGSLFKEFGEEEEKVIDELAQKLETKNVPEEDDGPIFETEEISRRLLASMLFAVADTYDVPFETIFSAMDGIDDNDCVHLKNIGKRPIAGLQTIDDISEPSLPEIRMEMIDIINEIRMDAGISIECLSHFCGKKNGGGFSYLFRKKENAGTSTLKAILQVLGTDLDNVRNTAIERIRKRSGSTASARWQNARGPVRDLLLDLMGNNLVFSKHDAGVLIYIGWLYMEEDGRKVIETIRGL